VGGSKRSGAGNSISRIHHGVRDRAVSIACRIAGTFGVASHNSRVRLPVQNRSRHRFCRPSPHDEMDSPNYGRSPCCLAPGFFCHARLFLLTPHHSHISPPTRLTNGIIKMGLQFRGSRADSPKGATPAGDPSLPGHCPRYHKNTIGPSPIRHGSRRPTTPIRCPEAQAEDETRSTNLCDP